MRRVWPDYIYRLKTLPRASQAYARNFLWPRTGVVACNRSFSSAGKTPTQQRLRSSLPVPQRYLSDDELHRRIRELREEEAKQARRKAFQLAIGEALTQRSPAIQAFPPLTPEAFVKPKDEDEQQQGTTSEDGEDGLSIGVTAPAILSRVGTPGTIIDANLVVSRAPAKKGILVSKSRAPLVYTKSSVQSKRQSIPNLPYKLAKNQSLQAKSNRDETIISRRNQHIELLSDFPAMEDHNLSAEDVDEASISEIIHDMESPDLSKDIIPEWQVSEDFAVEDAYQKLSPEWRALLENCQKVSRAGEECAQIGAGIEQIHFSDAKKRAWSIKMLAYEQSFYTLQREAHRLRHFLRNRFSQRLIYGDVVIIKTWHDHVIEKVHDILADFNMMRRLSAPHCTDIIQKRFYYACALMTEFRDTFHQNKNSVKELSYVRRLLRADSPLALIEKAYFFRIKGILKFAREAPRDLRDGISALRRASFLASAALRLEYGVRGELPLKERLLIMLRNRVHDKVQAVDAIRKQLQPMLDHLVTVIFLRTRREFENGRLQELEGNFDTLLSEYVQDLKRSSMTPAADEEHSDAVLRSINYLERHARFIPLAPIPHPNYRPRGRVRLRQQR